MLTNSQKLTEKVSAILDGVSGLDMLAIFAWIMGDVIVQSDANKEDVLDMFERMLEQAINILGSTKEELN